MNGPRKNLPTVKLVLLACAAALALASPVLAAKKNKKGKAAKTVAYGHPCSVLLKTGQLQKKFAGQDRKIASKASKEEYKAAVKTVENYIDNNGDIENVRAIAKYVQYAMRKKVSHVKVMIFLAAEITKGTEMRILGSECVLGDPVGMQMLRKIASHQ